MTKKKSDLLRTSENKRSSLYGEYYIFVKKIDVWERRGQEDCETFPSIHPVLLPSFGYSMLIRAVFETGPEYFAKACKQKWVYNISLSASAYGVSQSTYSFDISIFFPSLTTLNIIKEKCFIKLLLGDKEVYDALTYSLNFLPDLPGTPPLSAFEGEVKRQIVDIETRLKLQVGYPIAFEDIEEAQDMEIREQALRKFGYEDYVKEGFRSNKIVCVILSNNDILYIDPSFNKDYHDEFRRTVLSRRDEEKIIRFRDDIAFLQVKDTSTKKTYFLKVPPTMRSVKEAKAWTFGLEPKEYNPAVET